MGSQLTTLASSDIQRFERDGYLVVRQAFSPADGRAMNGDGGGNWTTRTAYVPATGPAGARSWAT
jgi:hypothetical protein